MIWSSMCSTLEMDEETLAHIFDRFYQGARKRISEGLGLAITKELVRAHSGKIWVESKLGKRKGSLSLYRSIALNKTPRKNLTSSR